MKPPPLPLVVVFAFSFASCVFRPEWTTTDGGHTYTTARGGLHTYSPFSSHPYTEEILITRQNPIAPNLSEWKLHSIDPDGTTTLKYTEKGTSNYITAEPGKAFPKFGNMTMTLIDASNTDGFARIEVSFGF